MVVKHMKYNFARRKKTCKLRFPRDTFNLLHWQRINIFTDTVVMKHAFSSVASGNVNDTTSLECSLAITTKIKNAHDF